MEYERESWGEAVGGCWRRKKTKKKPNTNKLTQQGLSAPGRFKFRQQIQQQIALRAPPTRTGNLKLVCSVSMTDPLFLSVEIIHPGSLRLGLCLPLNDSDPPALAAARFTILAAWRVRMGAIETSGIEVDSPSTCAFDTHCLLRQLLNLRSVRQSTNIQVTVP
jgi:hypothetical protein